MNKKNRRYEIHSKIRVPSMEQIHAAASDFSMPPEEQTRDFVSRNAKNITPGESDDKYNPALNDIKNDMLQLAMAVASAEVAEKDEGEGSLPDEVTIPDEVTLPNKVISAEESESIHTSQSGNSIDSAYPQK